ncbi:MAG TPA: hypothetical protein VKB38_04115 [Terracidiphilus sp.]|nr:hypothetical protein [Terracidiphilus sp.]
MTIRPFVDGSPTLSVLKLSPPEKGAALRRRASHSEGASGVEKVVDRVLPAPDPLAIRVPRIRERVRVDGHADPFFVIYVDTQRQVADLVCARRVGFTLEQVPFTAIRPAEIEPEEPRRQ